MDPDELRAKEIQDFLDALSRKRSSVSALDYSAPDQVKIDTAEATQSKLDGQKPTHRTALLFLVCSLSIASFTFLVCIIVFQMWKRLSYPGYNGVSDTVINILTGGVFGEVIAVVGVIVKYVWRDPK